MGTKSASTARAAAVRTAQAMAARRIQELKEREEQLAEILADYFEAKAHGEKVRADAKERAARLHQAAEQKAEKLIQEAQAAGEQLTTQAEKDAADYDAQIGAAVRRLLELGEPRTSVAEMTGLSQAVVRAMEREVHPGRRSRTADEPGVRAAAPRDA
jgi:cell division septum initiation protein DivIVA